MKPLSVDEDIVALFQGSFDELAAGVQALRKKLVKHQTDVDLETRLEWTVALNNIADTINRLLCSRDQCPHLATESEDLDRICAKHAQMENA